MCASSTVPESVDGFMRITAAAKYLSISPRTLRTWVARRLVPAYRPTKRLTLFRRDDLDKALSKFRTTGSGLCR